MATSNPAAIQLQPLRQTNSSTLVSPPGIPSPPQSPYHQSEQLTSNGQPDDSTSNQQSSGNEVSNTPMQQSSIPTQDTTSPATAQNAFIGFFLTTWLGNILACLGLAVALLSLGLTAYSSAVQVVSMKWSLQNNAFQSCASAYSLRIFSRYCNNTLAGGVPRPPITRRSLVDKIQFSFAGQYSWSSALASTVAVTIAAGVYVIVYSRPRALPFSPTVSLVRASLVEFSHGPRNGEQTTQSNTKFFVDGPLRTLVLSSEIEASPDESEYVNDMEPSFALVDGCVSDDSSVTGEKSEDSFWTNYERFVSEIEPLDLDGYNSNGEYLSGEQMPQMMRRPDFGYSTPGKLPPISASSDIFERDVEEDLGYSLDPLNSPWTKSKRTYKIRKSND